MELNPGTLLKLLGRDTLFLVELLRGGAYAWCHWQPSCPHEERGPAQWTAEQDMERARQSPMTLLEPLNPNRPAQICPWSFQFTEPVSCAFSVSQLGFLSIESEKALALLSLFSSGPQLWKREEGSRKKLPGLLQGLRAHPACS